MDWVSASRPPGHSALHSIAVGPSSTPPLVRLVPALPALWALLLLLIDCSRRLHRRLLPRRITLSEDASEAAVDSERPLFAVFVKDEDILACASDDDVYLKGGLPPRASSELSNEAAHEALSVSKPPLPLALVPCLEAFGWSVALIVAATRDDNNGAGAWTRPARDGEFNADLWVPAAHALAWVRLNLRFHAQEERSCSPM